MPEQSRSERKTQTRVIQLFPGPGGLGYDYLGEWNKRENNRALKQAMMQELHTGRTRLVPARVTEHDSQGKNPTL